MAPTCATGKPMSTGPGRRALSLAYLVPYSGVAAGLILLGFAVERALPASLAGGYHRSMFAALGGLARPVDALTDQSPEPVAGGVTRESAP